MTSCLGIYIEPNFIKYAKISKDHDILRVESFGIKFYDKLGDAIDQVISDTYSFKTQISINLSEESYQYFYMFTLLNKVDMKKAIQTEFESFCTDKGINKNGVEARYALVNSLDDKEKIKVIHVSANKSSILEQEQPFLNYKLSTIAPVSISISNIANLKSKENALIINMENETTITTVIDQRIYQVEKIQNGASEVLEGIRIKENSYSKAYEICKNSTIYTMEGQELKEDKNEYLDDIMPTLYTIASKVKEIIENDTIKIDRVYLTGTLSVVNNIDLYFQEVLQNEKVEILKPFFIKDTVKINIKDYIEVNSAISLALQGLEYGLKDMNFKKHTFKDNIDDIFAKLNISREDKTDKKQNKVLSNIFSTNFRGKLSSSERWMLRVLGGALILTVMYSGFSIFLNKEIDKKNLEVAEVKQDTAYKITKVEKDIKDVQSKTSEYQRLAENLRNISNQVSEDNKNRNNIPNLLSQIMHSIPQGVQITSIENPSAKHIIIQAQSQKYEQLGYFKAILKTQGILSPSTVVSSDGERSGEVVKVRIEGDLP
ncbi:unknown [Clostridium sp. CAG:508]|nr:unknown [Clostridium sp. CAG:508]